MDTKPIIRNLSKNHGIAIYANGELDIWKRNNRRALNLSVAEVAALKKFLAGKKASRK